MKFLGLKMKKFLFAGYTLSLKYVTINYLNIQFAALFV